MPESDNITPNEFINIVRGVVTSNSEEVGVKPETDLSGVITGPGSTLDKKQRWEFSTEQQSWFEDVAEVIGKTLEIGVHEPKEVRSEIDYDRLNYEELKSVNRAVKNIKLEPILGQEDKTPKWLEIVKQFLGTALLGLGALGAAIWSIFQGPGVLGSIGNIITKILATLYGVAARNLNNTLTRLIRPLSAIGRLVSRQVGRFVGRVTGFFGNLASRTGLARLFGGLPRTLSRGAGAIMSTLRGIVTFFVRVGARALRMLPFIGSLVSFYFAYKRFQQGDYIGSFLELSSGLLNLIPGIGWILSIGLDLFILIREMRTTEEERLEQSEGVIGKIIKGIVNFYIQTLPKVLRYMPVFSTLFGLYDAYQAMRGGDMRGALVALATGLVPFGLGNLLGRGVGMMLDLIDNTEREDTKPIQRIASIIPTIRKWIGEKLKKLPRALLAPLRWLGILDGDDQSDVDASMTDVASDTTERIKKAHEAGLGSVSSAILSIGSSARNLFSSAREQLSGVVDVGKDVWNVVVDVGGDLLRGLERIVEPFSSSVATVINSVVDVVDGVSYMVRSVITAIYSPIDHTLEAIIGITNSITTLFNATYTAIQTVLDAVDKTTLSVITIVTRIRDAVSKIFDVIDGIVGRVTRAGFNAARDVVERFRGDKKDAQFEDQSLQHLASVFTTGPAGFTPSSDSLYTITKNSFNTLIAVSRDQLTELKHIKTATLDVAESVKNIQPTTIINNPEGQLPDPGPGDINVTAAMMDQMSINSPLIGPA